MRTYDEDEVVNLNAEPWQLDLLKLNPEYVYWGPHEDYMWNEKGGWDSRQLFGSWKEFGPWGLDELNECVNFYFSVNRENVICDMCDGDGYHPDAREVVDSFYRHSSPTGKFWHDKITPDEAQALHEANRLRNKSFDSNKIEFVTYDYEAMAKEVNATERKGGLDGHDVINRHILIKTRLKRLNIPKQCPKCNGTGHVYVADKAHVALTLWMLHPRKGCSRGVEVSNITQEDLPYVFEWLKQARDRNNDRFSKLV